MSEPTSSKKRSDAAARQRDLMGSALRRTPSEPEAAAAAPRPVAPRVKPVRITVDLAPDLHNQLKVWTATESVKLSDVFRALSSRMLSDPALAAQIRADIRENTSQ
ncbi:MAG TPA: hypothetical protein VIQ11_05155 [Mycobacterium sp.]